MEEDIRFKILNELSPNKKFTLISTKHFKDDIEELLNEGLIMEKKIGVVSYYRITMKGFIYIKEYQKLKSETVLSKFSRNTFVPLFVLSVILSLKELSGLFALIWQWLYKLFE